MAYGVGAVSIVETHDLVKEFRGGADLVRALDGVNLAVAGGEFVAVTGASGAGKSTLLHLLGGLDRPSSGRVLFDGVELGGLSDNELAELRRRRLGFVFQFFHLLPTLTAWENVAVPRLLDGVPLRRTRARALELLEQVGLADRAEHRPSELSGGEMQRTALARALVADPRVVLADEPTGNLDSKTGAGILDLLGDLAGQGGRTVVMVSHDPEAAGRADRVVHLVDGRVSRGTLPPETDQV